MLILYGFIVDFVLSSIGTIGLESLIRGMKNELVAVLVVGLLVE